MELLCKARNIKHIRLAAIFVALNIFDAVLTWTMAQQGGRDLNPIARIVLEQDSALAYYGYKLGGTFIVIAALLFLSRIAPRLVGKVFIVAIILFVGVCLFNLAGFLSWI